ncbi:MAG: hypothetical protein KKA81_08595 [Bacteroidetes bacterium]|nr:hypothetical protein [Bacteroidota bacterium]
MERKDVHITLASYFQSKPLYLDGENFKKPNVRKLVEQLGLMIFEDVYAIHSERRFPLLRYDQTEILFYQIS